MHDGEDGVAPVEEQFVGSPIDRLMSGEPAAADHEDDAVAVRVLRRLKTSSVSGAELAAVDHVLGAGEIGGSLRACAGRAGA